MCIAYDIGIVFVLDSVLLHTMLAHAKKSRQK